MKTRIMMMMFTLIVATSSFAQQRVASYYCRQTTCPYASVPSVSPNQSIIVEWYDNGTIKMSDGTAWRHQGDSNGVHVYSFLSTSLYIPGTRYVNVGFSNDYSVMQVNYYFGMLGMEYPMTSVYGYLGEGRQPAYDWYNYR